MQSVPQFPEFRKFTALDKSWYNNFYKNFPPIADFSYGNIEVWLNEYDDLMISKIGGNIVFSCTVLFMHKSKIITLLGVDSINHALEIIFSYQKLKGLTQIVQMLPEVVAKRVTSSAYKVEHDRDNDDYLYKVEDLVSPKGGRMSQLRNEINVYEKKFGSRTKISIVNLDDPGTLTLFKSSLQEWSDVYSNNDAGGAENRALTRLFDYAGSLPQEAVALYVQDSLEGFLIFQELPQKTTALFNHAKVSYKYKYMFDYLIHCGAKIMQDRGIEVINLEQDLGIEGLRLHKNSLRPYSFLKKMSVRPVL